MAFTLKRRELVRKGFQRLMRRQLENAAEELRNCRRPESIHYVRRAIKKARALLRMMRGAMGRAECRRYSEVLRKAARQLAGSRDAEVKVAALDKLLAEGGDGSHQRQFRGIKELLEAEHDREEAKLLEPEPGESVSRLLNGLSKELAHPKLQSSGWRAIGPGVKRTYRDGRRAYDVARTNGIAEDFHKWRKRVKDLRYQIQLLRSIQSKWMCHMEADLAKIGETLGEDHDLFLLIVSSAAKGSSTARAELSRLAETRQRKLRQEALALGARCYGEKPSAFCTRLKREWKRRR